MTKTLNNIAQRGAVYESFSISESKAKSLIFDFINEIKKTITANRITEKYKLSMINPSVNFIELNNILICLFYNEIKNIKVKLGERLSKIYV
jgi:hypothetical protein